MSRLAAICLLLLPFTSSPAADRICAPSALLKVVTTTDAPDLPPDHFSRIPKTLYRFGEGSGRIEEAPNPQSGLHILIVVNEPDIWMVDLAAHQGQYQKDPGPTYYFMARLFADDAAQSTFIRALEIGCESKWMREAGAKPVNTVHPTLGSVMKLEFVEGQERLVLFERDGKPVQLELYGPAGWLMSTNYLSYEPNLKPVPRLFKQPKGIRFD